MTEEERNIVAAGKAAMEEGGMRAFGGTLETDSPEMRATSDYEASLDGYEGEPDFDDPDGMGGSANPYPMIRGLVDIRSKLRRQSWGGPTARRSLSQKSGGAVVHFAGPAQNRSVSALARLQSYAEYHCRSNGFGEGATGNGLMYHLAVAEDGTKYLCRDLEEDRWHCGAWPHNGTWISIQLPMGKGQEPTAAQIKSVAEIVLDWLKYRGLGRSYVKGHREVGPSECPEDIIMARIVRPIQRGENPGGTTPPGDDPTPSETKEWSLVLAEDHKAGRQVGRYRERANLDASKKLLEGTYGMKLSVKEVEGKARPR